MYLSRHRAAAGPRWALNGHYLPEGFTLDRILEIPASEVRGMLEDLSPAEAAEDPLLAPVEPAHEVWASGVTYLRSREARELESADANAYERVYDAERPELFFKAQGWRVVGHGESVRVRRDSRWNVPEPELVLVLNNRMEIVGFTAGNDVSSRDIEGENPLYLPQAKVYDAERPELFFKAQGWRVVGHGESVRVRRDSRWNVPEPELVLVLNNRMEIVGFTAGNDVSSRDIEGENPLYLPQAKVYDGACSLGPGITLADAGAVRQLPIRLRIRRGQGVVFEDETATSQMKRDPTELADYLGRELVFPVGAFLMTGTGIVPDEDFTLEPGDGVEISVGDLVLENEVAR